MRFSIIVLTSVFTLLGCESAHEKQLHATEKKIQAAANFDWKSDIPFDQLSDAKIVCNKNPGLKYCDVIDQRLMDISTTLSSCVADQRTTLCKKIINFLSQNKIFSLLPKAEAVELPSSPVYWKLPTAMLESLADQGKYRIEVSWQWWSLWKQRIYFCSALLLIIAATWAWWSHDTKSKAELATLAAEKRAKQISQEKIRRQKQEAARIESEQQAQLDHEEAKAEQARIQAELYKKQQAALAEAKLVAEQSEAALILEVAFNSTTPKRRKHHAHTTL